MQCNAQPKLKMVTFVKKRKGGGLGYNKVKWTKYYSLPSSWKKSLHPIQIFSDQTW